MRAWAAVLIALWAAPLPAAWPSEVAALLPRLEPAERRLQDATLAQEAARREAQPASDAVVEARLGADHWWGRWRLRRALGRLKGRLDRVEAARVEREAARQELFMLLTALEEELRSALEGSLAAAMPKEQRRSWWEQTQAWSKRLEGLESAVDAAAASEQERSKLLAQARLEQLVRDLAILDALERKAVLSPAEARTERSRLRRAVERWRRLAH